MTRQEPVFSAMVDHCLHFREGGWLKRDEPHDAGIALQRGERCAIGLGEAPQRHPVSFHDDVHRLIQLMPALAMGAMYP